MIVQKYDSLLKLINLSSNMYYEELIRQLDYCNKEKCNSEKWFELIYTILAGTQVQTKIVQKSFNSLFFQFYDILNPRFLRLQKDFSFVIEITEKSLKESGYRFNSQKSKTIYNTIVFFSKYKFDIKKFLVRFDTYKDIRVELSKIKGIGMKIASHWLRNIGFPIPIIDRHIKNLLKRFGFINTDKKLVYKDFEDIQNKITHKIHLNINYFDLCLWIYGKNMCGNKKCNECQFKLTCINL